MNVDHRRGGVPTITTMLWVGAVLLLLTKIQALSFCRQSTSSSVTTLSSTLLSLQRHPNTSWSRHANTNKHCSISASPVPLSLLRTSKNNEIYDKDDEFMTKQIGDTSRRHVFHIATTTAAASIVFGAGSVIASNEPALAAETATDGKSKQDVLLIQNKSGLKYIEVKVGTGPSPQYGQLVSISYKAYIKLPAKPGETSPDPEKYDADKAYLIKHGNGKQVPGLDEGLHTMRVGGVRRIICPPKLGYVVGGLGPLPASPLGRFKLNRLLEGMVERRGGQVIFDVELRSVRDDEADQGYYDDANIDPDDFERLRERLTRSTQKANGNNNESGLGVIGEDA